MTRSFHTELDVLMRKIKIIQSQKKLLKALLGIVNIHLQNCRASIIYQAKLVAVFSDINPSKDHANPYFQRNWQGPAALTSLNLARNSQHTASRIRNVLIRVLSYGWGFTLTVGTD